jgi:hypothetical protein
MQMSKHQQTVWNRTEMHSGIRGATERCNRRSAGRAHDAARRPSITMTTAAQFRRARFRHETAGV